MNVAWRTMNLSDIPSVYAIANQVHDLYEAMEVFVERLRLCPEGCFVLQADTIVGYALSHPYTRNSPRLNTLIHVLPEEASCWYIHDISILPPYRGKGAASVLLSKLYTLALAKGFREMALTSICHSFWRHHGFVDHSVHDPSYGDSLFMVKFIKNESNSNE